MHSQRKYDLEERLLDYSANIVRLVESMNKTQAAHHIGTQLMRSGTSPLFNHGEAEAAESTKDFVHKLRICLKELRESKRALLLIKRIPLVRSETLLNDLLKETEELIRIFVVSIRTSNQKLQNNVKEDQHHQGGISSHHRSLKVKKT